MFTSIFEFFALGTIGFYILLAVLSILFITCVEYEHYMWPTILSLGFFIIYWKAFFALHLDWRMVLLGVGIYAVAGILWSFFRWKRHIKRLSDEYLDDWSESKRSRLKDELRFSNNLSRITGWLAYWPWSLAWNITGDFFKMIAEGLAGVYQKMADNAIARLPEPTKKHEDNFKNR